MSHTATLGLPDTPQLPPWVPELTHRMPDAYLGLHGVLCRYKKLHLPLLAFRDSDGTLSLQVEVLLATNVHLT